MEQLDLTLPWEKKTPKAIWRGTTHYNPEIRDKLVETAKGTTWGDVQIVSRGEDDENFVTLGDHCK